MTSKEKLDSLLGISSGETLDDMLSDIEMSPETTEDLISEIDSSVHHLIEKTDEAIKDNPSQEDLINIKSNLDSVGELVNVSKQIIKHLYDNIINTDLIDTELVNSAATFIEVTHRNVKEYIDLYKDRLRFYDKVRLEAIQQENRKELINLKHKNDLEKIRMRSESSQNIQDTENMVSYTQEDITMMLKEMDNK